MHRHITAGLVAAALVSTLAPPSSAAPRPGPRHRRPAPALAPAGKDGLSRALGQGLIGEAEYALERAAAVLAPAPTRSGDVSGTEPRLATLYLRDLAARLGELRGEDRRRARRLLARPTQPDEWEQAQGIAYEAPPEDRRRDCTEDFCVHWVVSTEDAPDVSADADGDAVPDWIEAVGQEMTTIWSTVEGMGYRAPKPDAGSADNGGDARLDVYIAELFAAGVYGYCATDDPNVLDETIGYQYYDASAYCVLDNDYAEYADPGLPSLRATAAHEFFHAVQFAYDAFEDVWLMEGTAAWIEDEIYDDINDNYQFLHKSHLVNPAVPLDFGDTADGNNGLFPYGSFLFWRFLSEYPKIGGTPEVIREIWERADGSPLGPHPAGADDYSARAAGKVLAQRGSALRDAFNDFGIVNLAPQEFYEEGSAYRAVVGGSPPMRVRARLTAARPGARRRLRLDHLTTAYARFRPGRGVSDRARIGVRLDGPRRARGTEAALVVFRRDGARDVRYFRLDRGGDGAVAAPFGRGRVARVVVVLSNGSARFRNCYSGATPYSCSGGVPIDDNAAFEFRARLRQ